MDSLKVLPSYDLDKNMVIRQTSLEIVLPLKN